MSISEPTIYICKYCESPLNGSSTIQNGEYDFSVCQSCRADSDDLLVSVPIAGLTTAQNACLSGGWFDEEAHKRERAQAPRDIGAYLDWIDMKHPADLAEELASMQRAIARAHDVEQEMPPHPR